MLRLFNHYFPSSAVFQALLDALLLFIAIVSANLLVGHGLAVWPRVAGPAFLFALVMVIVSSAFGLYRIQFEARVRDTVMRVVFTVGVSIPVAWLLFNSLPDNLSGEGVVETTGVVLLGLVMVGRGVARRVMSASSMWNSRVLVIGAGREAASVEHSLTHPAHPGLTIVGFYPIAGAEDAVIHPSRILSSRRSLLETVRELKVQKVIVAVRERRGGPLPLAQLLDCKLSGVKILDLSSFFEMVRGQVRVDSLRASWLIYGEGFRQSCLRMAIKRIFDIVVALVLLCLTAPIMLAAMVFIALEDGFPIFYRQERVGQGGRLFKVIKFRSMRQDAEKDGRPRWATSNDDRATRVGRIMRKTRIDELPQLFNVLVGEMSMVGPRPERPFFVDQLTQEIPFYAVRHSVKPGVTGWAQVRYQYGASVDDAVQKLQYDLYYVKNHTLFLDLLVLAETVRVVTTGEGAH